MQPYLRDFFVSRICAGYLKYTKDNKTLIIKPPTELVMYDACCEYLEAYNDAKEEGLLTEEEIIVPLCDAGIWTHKMSEDYDNLPKIIEDTKVALLGYAFRPVELNKTRQILNKCRDEFNRLSRIRHSWDYTTCEGTASLVKWQYIIENSTFNKDGSKYEWDEISPSEVLAYYQENILSESIIRELVRNEPWGSIWSIKKKNGKIFDEPMTQEQRTIIMWSLTYDIVHESPECPQEEIIEDDDMLDGWFIEQRRKRQKDKSKDYADSLITNKKISGADEILVVAKSKKEIDSIHNMNNFGGELIRKRRLKQVEQEGEVPIMKFKDMQDRLRMEATNKLSQHYKEGRR